MENRFLALIKDSIQQHWALPALSDSNGKTYNYKDFAEEIEKLHLFFEQAGLPKGAKVSLIGRNSSHWAICFFGILAYGAVVVPILHDFKPESVHHIVNHSESEALIITEQNWEALDASSMPNLKFVLKIEDFSVINSKETSLREKQAKIEVLFLEKYPEGYGPKDISFHKEEPEELAVLNYTSGTTGNTKGVMIPYRSLWSNTKYAYDNIPFVHAGDNFVCVLPMAHMYGLAFEVLNGINKGCHIHFLPRIPSPKTLIDAFAQARPALILAVPLIIEKIIRNNVFPIVNKPYMKVLLKTPLVGPIIRRKIREKVDQVFGSKFEEIVIGGAAINKEVETFLRSIGFRYTVGYGMTECGPLIAYEQWNTYKAGSVGRVVDRMEIKIDSPDPQQKVGEILVRGMNVMLGYYKNPKATEQALGKDGWMRTGDLGILDEDGFLYIRGRSKTMILSSNGQNIYPEEIEDLLNNKKYVSESLIVTRDDKLVALIYPEWEEVKKEGIGEEDLKNKMDENLAELNQSIPGYCKISSFQLRDVEFEKTPKRSIKRYLYQNPETDS
ncbi:AMP-binding protein [Parabacteroides sp. Marseille-P3160]|uniref:AMP-binding protein n=1 Tax=Parabacteroides sp. Marseille-P3160 TaxID=1917887 RepID=UPI0009B9C10E|nr:AMP-binding protein [Parabacteroides sp. Marseille-P3160]